MVNLYFFVLIIFLCQVDDDNSGAIDFDEFLSMMGNRKVFIRVRILAFFI